MQELKTKIVVLGIGSDLRGDDAAGVIVAKNLEKNPPPGIVAINGGTAPENFTGKIKKLKPSYLLIIDAVEMKEPPGTIKLIGINDIGGYSFSTHALPLKVMIGFLVQDWPCEIIIIGVQPKRISFGAPISKEVETAAEAVAEAIRAATK